MSQVSIRSTSGISSGPYPTTSEPGARNEVNKPATQKQQAARGTSGVLAGHTVAAIQTDNPPRLNTAANLSLVRVSLTQRTSHQGGTSNGWTRRMDGDTFTAYQKACNNYSAADFKRHANDLFPDIKDSGANPAAPPARESVSREMPAVPEPGYDVIPGEAPHDEAPGVQTSVPGSMQESVPSSVQESVQEYDHLEPVEPAHTAEIQQNEAPGVQTSVPNSVQGSVQESVQEYDHLEPVEPAHTAEIQQNEAPGVQTSVQGEQCAGYDHLEPVEPAHTAEIQQNEAPGVQTSVPNSVQEYDHLEPAEPAHTAEIQQNEAPGVQTSVPNSMQGSVQGGECAGI